MFTLQNLLHLLEKENRGWKNPTTMTKAVLTALTDYNYASDIASKIFSGVNQGRNICFEIENLISEEGFKAYLSGAELRLRNQNFRNGNFDSLKMTETTYSLLKESTNLNQDIYQGLIYSYAKNKEKRPYLFLVECFYYALACRCNRTLNYKTENIFEIKNTQTLPDWGGDLDDALLEECISPKLWTTVEQMTFKEVTVFKNLAKLVVIDEDEEYYLYAPVTDEEIQLYKDFILDYHLGSGTTASVAHKMNRQYIGIEQMDYIKTISVERLKKVIEGEQGGISKDVNWQGGGSFVYAELKNDVQDFKDAILEATTTEELLDLFELAKKSSFLSYRIEPKKLKKQEFRRLSLAEQKQILSEIIDNNNLYVNYSDIDDNDYNISERDKKLNRQFYGEE